jgi:hypothetical protein
MLAPGSRAARHTRAFRQYFPFAVNTSRDSVCEQAIHIDD